MVLPNPLHGGIAEAYGCPPRKPEALVRFTPVAEQALSSTPQDITVAQTHMETVAFFGTPDRAHDTLAMLLDSQPTSGGSFEAASGATNDEAESDLRAAVDDDADLQAASGAPDDEADSRAASSADDEDDDAVGPEDSILEAALNITAARKRQSDCQPALANSRVKRCY